MAAMVVASAMSVRGAPAVAQPVRNPVEVTWLLNRPGGDVPAANATRQTCMVVAGKQEEENRQVSPVHGAHG